MIAAVRHLTERGEPVSVSSLVREAGIHRTTFYTHFSGIDDLVASLLEEEILELERWQSDVERSETDWSELRSQTESFRRFTVHVEENRALYTALLQVSSGSEARRRSARILAEATETRIRAVGRPPEGTDIPLVARAIASAYLSVVEQWLLERSDLTSSDVVDQLLAVMPRWVADPSIG